MCKRHALAGVALAVALAVGGLAAAEAVSARELLQASDRARGGDIEGLRIESTVTAYRGDAIRGSYSLLIESDRNNSLVSFVAPARSRGILMLIRGRNMWFISPDAQKPVPISPRQRLLGEATNGDIATTGDPKFSALFEEHPAEEFDHAKKLFQDRSALARTTPAEVWDPALDAAANWFLAKMLRLDDAEKAVLVHLVLEVGSKVFHGVTDPILSPYGETDYFEIHDEADDRHEGMCVPELDGLDERTYERLFLVQKQGWDMLEAMCARMTELVLSSS